MNQGNVFWLGEGLLVIFILFTRGVISGPVFLWRDQWVWTQAAPQQSTVIANVRALTVSARGLSTPSSEPLHPTPTARSPTHE